MVMSKMTDSAPPTSSWDRILKKDIEKSEPNIVKRDQYLRFFRGYLKRLRADISKDLEKLENLRGVPKSQKEDEPNQSKELNNMNHQCLYGPISCFWLHN